MPTTPLNEGSLDKAINAYQISAGQKTYISADTVAPRTAPRTFETVRMEDLTSDAFNTPVDVLVNLWLSRFGNEWVDVEDIDHDVFFRNAYKRLRALGQLETHYLTDRARYVCRKPE